MTSYDNSSRYRANTIEDWFFIGITNSILEVTVTEPLGFVKSLSSFNRGSNNNIIGQGSMSLTAATDPTVTYSELGSYTISSLTLIS